MAWRVLPVRRPLLIPGAIAPLMEARAGGNHWLQLRRQVSGSLRVGDAMPHARRCRLTRIEAVPAVEPTFQAQPLLRLGMHDGDVILSRARDLIPCVFQIARYPRLVLYPARLYFTAH